MAGKPTAAEVKKLWRNLLDEFPSGITPARAITVLSNQPQAIEALRQQLPDDGRDGSELRMALARLGGVLAAVDSWADGEQGAKKSSVKKSFESDSSDVVSNETASVNEASAIVSFESVKVFTDGACKGNPGPSSVGIVIEDLEGLTIYEEGRYLGEMTNNAAEYQGLIAALEILIANGCPKTYVFMDSKLVVNQVNGLWKVKNSGIMPLVSQVQKLRRQLPVFKLTHVLRDKNQRADTLANQAIDRQFGRVRRS